MKGKPTGESGPRAALGGVRGDTEELFSGFEFGHEHFTHGIQMFFDTGDVSAKLVRVVYGGWPLPQSPAIRATGSGKPAGSRLCDHRTSVLKLSRLFAILRSPSQDVNHFLSGLTQGASHGQHQAGVDQRFR